VDENGDAVTSEKREQPRTNTKLGKCFIIIKRNLLFINEVNIVGLHVFF